MTNDLDAFFDSPPEEPPSLAERWPLLPPDIREINAEIEELRQRLFILDGPYSNDAKTPEVESEVVALAARERELEQQVDAMAIEHFGLISNETLVRGHGWNQGQLAIFRELIRAEYDRHTPWLRVTIVEPSEMCGEGRKFYTGWELAGATVTDAMLAAVADAKQRRRSEGPAS